MFKKAIPESVGISSAKILDFVKCLDECRMHTHSIFMARGDKVVAEGYYAPFHKDFLHRMYSVSKSFVAVAVGLAVTEGLIRMEDVIVDYFPEFRNENVDEFHEECTVRDMLCMQSNIGEGMQWWGRFDSRVEAYYSLKTGKIPGTLYFYDSIGSFLLGCIIEKLTGKPFLEYLKEKVLLDIGFSKESFTLKEPGGFTVGDSGVMCTTRDLALFARFILNKGEWNGKQYIDRGFMEDAVSRQVCNDLEGSIDAYNTGGYGYLIWKTHPDGFSLVGMGDQLAVCDMKKDFLFVITSDNQANRAARYLIYHELYRNLIPSIQEKPLAEDPEAYEALEAYLRSRKLVCMKGAMQSAILGAVNGKHYTARKNSLGITGFKLEIQDAEGVLTLDKGGLDFALAFSLCENKINRFSFGDRPVRDMMGKNEPGEYDCAVSAAWVDEKTISVMAQVIDTYFGCLNIHIGFKDNRATVLLKKSGQYVFDGMEGSFIAFADKE